MNLVFSAADEVHHLPWRAILVSVGSVVEMMLMIGKHVLIKPFNVDQMWNVAHMIYSFDDREIRSLTVEFADQGMC